MRQGKVIFLFAILMLISNSSAWRRRRRVKACDSTFSARKPDSRSSFIELDCDDAGDYLIKEGKISPNYYAVGGYESIECNHRYCRSVKMSADKRRTCWKCTLPGNNRFTALNVRLLQKVRCENTVQEEL